MISHFQYSCSETSTSYSGEVIEVLLVRHSAEKYLLFRPRARKYLISKFLQTQLNKKGVSLWM